MTEANAPVAELVAEDAGSRYEALDALLDEEQPEVQQEEQPAEPVESESPAEQTEEQPAETENEKAETPEQLSDQDLLKIISGQEQAADPNKIVLDQNQYAAFQEFLRSRQAQPQVQAQQQPAQPAAVPEFLKDIVQIDGGEYDRLFEGADGARDVLNKVAVESAKRGAALARAEISRDLPVMVQQVAVPLMEAFTMASQYLMKHPEFESCPDSFAAALGKAKSEQPNGNIETWLNRAGELVTGARTTAEKIGKSARLDVRPKPAGKAPSATARTGAGRFAKEERDPTDEAIEAIARYRGGRV